MRQDPGHSYSMMQGAGGQEQIPHKTFISALAEGVAVSQSGCELLQHVLCGCVTALQVLYSSLASLDSMLGRKGGLKELSAGPGPLSRPKRLLSVRKVMPGRRTIPDVKIMLLCSGAGGSKADCAFCLVGSDAAEECAAIGSSLLVIKPFHFKTEICEFLQWEVSET